MAISPRGALRTYGVALRALLVLTVVLGIGYPAVITLAAQVVAPAQAHGSQLTVDGKAVGSALIGQSFTDADGAPLREWFQSRPSAGGHDATASGGSNLGPESSDLVDTIEQRRAAVAAFEGVDPASVPADALTASASGLDPEISPAYARLQVARVAAARGLPEADVAALVTSTMRGSDLGFLSEPGVNVLRLNAALVQLDAKE